MLRNIEDEILIGYLSQSWVYIHKAQINYFGGPENLAIGIVGLASLQYLRMKWKGMLLVYEGNSKQYYQRVIQARFKLSINKRCVVIKTVIEVIVKIFSVKI